MTEGLGRLGELALRYASFYGGKIEMIPRVPVTGLDDFSILYTPGVAAVCNAIRERPELNMEYTSRWNTIAVITDGSRVLGLGKIGPEASMPVMEGKAVIFKYLGGVDAVPIPIAPHEEEKIVEVVKALEPAFGGINLEDIESPKCFYILDKLRKELKIPVWHDDQLGTAGATLAALINSLKLTDRKMRQTKIVLFGAGASNIATARILIAAGADPGELILVDRKGILHPEREDMDELMLKNHWKYTLAIDTNKDRVAGDVREAMKGSDVLVAASTPGPGIIKKEWISKMNKNAIVFALANPIPEIWPEEAKQGGATIVATGRSDFPNQVNNSLVFPSVFRGALDVRARSITDGMIISASNALAEFREEMGMNRDHIVPTMDDWKVYPHVAAAVAEKAVEEGLALKKLTRNEELYRAEQIIAKARRTMSVMLQSELILMPPKIKEA